MAISQHVRYRTGYWLYHTFWASVDWVYPPFCGGCQKFGVRWCDDCQQSVFQLRTAICPKCGSYEPHGLLCQDCQAQPPPFQALRSWGHFAGPLRLAIHQIKYKQDLGLAEALSIPLIELFQTCAWPVDLVTAVPLSLKRQAERGYNQSNLLARPISLAFGIAFRPKAITRARHTVSQVGLSAAERSENVRGAFLADRAIVQNKKVLIVDDVTTTGSTLQSCTQALLEAGAAEVYGLTLAKSLLEEDLPVAIQAAASAVNA